jgi:hypothetical protein
LELVSAQDIIRLLQRETNPKERAEYENPGRPKTGQARSSAFMEGNVSKWTDIIPGRHKRPKKPVVKQVQPIPTILNRCTVLGNHARTKNRKKYMSGKRA